MKKQPILRLFYALWPDTATRAALQHLQQALPLNGRPVPADNLHITLAFLGEQADAFLPVLESILKRLPSPEFQLSLDKLGYFKGSRTAWIGMQTPPLALMELQADLERALKSEAITYVASGKFTPHVTLARSAAPLSAVVVRPLRWESAQLALVRSVLLPDGSRYEVIASR